MSNIFLRLILLVTFGAFSFSTYAEREFDFGDGLRKKGYYDLAIRHFEKVKAGRKVSAVDKTRAILGLGSIYEDMARTERDAKKKGESLAKAREAYTEYLKQAKPGSNQYADALFRQARLQKNGGKAFLDASIAEKDATKKAALESKAKGLLEKAIKAFEALRESDDKISIKLEEKGKKISKVEKKQMGVLRQRKASAMIEALWARFFYAQVTNLKKDWKELASQGEDFTFQWENTSISLWGPCFNALGLLHLGKEKDARSEFETVLEGDDNKWTETIFYQSYYLFATEAFTLKNYKLCIEICEQFVDNYPRPPKSKLGISAAIRLMLGDAYLSSEDVDQHQEGLDVWVKLASTKLPGSYDAKKRIKEAYQKHADLPKFTSVLMAEAEGYIAEKNFMAAVDSFQEAYRLASPLEKRKYALKIYERMALCYAWADMRRESGLVFEYLFDRYPNAGDRCRWSGNALAFYGKVFNKSRSKADKVRYSRALERNTLSCGKKDGKGDGNDKKDPNYSLATVKESSQKTKEAITYYSKVKKGFKHYTKSQYKVAYLPWKVVRAAKREAKKRKKKFNIDRYKKEIDQSLKSFGDFKKLVDKELPKADKALKADLNKYWAKSLSDLGDIEQALGHKDKALAHFTQYLKNYIKHYETAEAHVLLSSMILYKDKKNWAALHVALQRLKQIKPGNSNIPTFGKILAGTFLNEFNRLKKDPKKEADANKAAKKSADYYYEIFLAGQKLSKKPSQHIAIVELIGDIYAGRVKMPNRALKCYQAILKNLGKPREIDKKRLMFPIVDKRVRKEALATYEKFVDLLEDKDDLSKIRSKEWKEDPINYAEALKMAYDYNRKKDTYKAGGKFKSAHKLTKEALDDILPTIKQRQQLIEIKTKIAEVYVLGKQWSKALPILEELDRYYLLEISTKRKLAYILSKNGKHARAQELFWTIREALDKNSPAWYDATLAWADACLNSGNQERIKKAHKILNFTIVSTGGKCPDKIKKKATTLAGKIKE